MNLPKKFVHQSEINKNLSPKIKKDLEEVEKSGYQIENYEYFSEPQEELIAWEEYIKTLDKNLTTLQIIPNKFKFENNKLVIKKNDFPNLTTLYACGLGLEEVELNCPTLKNLYLTDNKLERLDLDNTPLIQNLVISKNNIKFFNVNHLSQLKALICNKNKPIFKLSEGIIRPSLDVSDLTKLVYLDCSQSHLRFLNVEGCKRLKVLDADLNDIDKRCLDFPKLSKLETLSLKLNNFNVKSVHRKKATILTLRSPNLKYLVYDDSDIGKVIHKKGLNNELQVINDETRKSIYKDLSTEEQIQAWEKQVDETIANSNELDLIRHLFGDTHIDHEQKEKEIEEKLASDNEENKNPPITDPSSLSNNYPNLIDKQTEEITLTHKFLVETLIVEDCPNLTSLNVGNNYLSYLVVRNCPKLEYLRYAHNKLKHDCFIIECNNIKEIAKENFEGKKVWDTQGNELFEKGELKPQIDTFDKPKPKKLTETDKALTKITSLLRQAQDALENKDYSKLSELINQIKELLTKITDTEMVAIINGEIAKLERSQLVQTTSLSNHLSWIIGSLIALPIIYLIITELVVKYYQKKTY